MTRTRWRTLAGVLALTFGGIVVVANDTPKDLALCRQDSPPCPIPGCPPSSPCPQRFEEPSCPPIECPGQNPEADTSPVPCQPPVKFTYDLDIPINAGSSQHVILPIAPPAPVVQPVIKQVTATANVAYKVRMEMIGAITQIELMHGDTVSLRVQCDRVDVQMPSGGIQAIGKVCVSAPGIDIRCNRMMIGWQAGEIAMEGQVRILCQTGQQRTEMSAESVNCRLNSVGTGLDFNPRDAGKQVD